MYPKLLVETCARFDLQIRWIPGATLDKHTCISSSTDFSICRFMHFIFVSVEKPSSHFPSYVIIVSLAY